MSDNNTSYFDLYKALKADGAVQGDWGSFHKFIGAPGKQGYLNRKKLYDALKADGAVQSGSYEEFNMKLFRGGQASLKAAKQRQTQKPVQSQPSKPMTTAERARQIGQEYMQGKAGKSNQASAGNTSSTDYMQNWRLMHMRGDQMTPTQQMQANTMRSRMQQAQKQATQQEQRQASPISQSRITPNAQNFNETMQQLSSSQAKRARAVQQREDDAANLAQYEVEGNQFAHNDGKHGTIAPEIDSLVAPSMKEADDLSWAQYQQDLKNAGNDAFLRNKAWKDLQDNRIKNRQNVLANNLSAKLQEIYSQKGLQEHIIESADKLNMGVEEYVDKYVTPQMMQRAQNILGVKNIEEILPQSATEYVVRRLSDSILGTLSAGQDKSREQIAREQEAMAIADGLEEMPTVKGYKANEGYKSGAGARFTSTAANMAMDSPILGMTGGAANMTVDLGKQVLMKGLAKAGLVKMGANLTAQQLAFKAANMTMAQKIASGLVEGSAKGALNLGGYSSITAALGQASTGDDTSLSALGKAALEGFEHGATTGAMFGVSGAIMAPWVSKFGINGLETSTGEKWLHGAQKLGATGVGLGVEAGTMMVADNITGDKDISVGTWLEDLVMVGAFKAGEPKNYAHIGSALYGLVHNTNNTFRVGKDQNGKWRTVDIHMTKDEQNELMNSVSGKNLVEAFQKVDKSSLNSKTPLDKSITKQAYQDFMNDPDVSQSTKEKVNAAMGLFNTTSAKSYRSVNDVQNKQILEYSKNGTLLTRTSYKNAEERRAILYKQKLYRDNEEMRSLAGYSKLKDLQPTDENGEVTRLAFAFLTDKGYNPNETVTEANNARLIAGMRDKNSDLYKEWEKYVDRFGSLGMLISDTTTWKNGLLEVFIGDREINLDTIMRKDPMKRTDEENKIFYQVKDALESELFPNGKPHAEQSETQGLSVAEDNNLGTEQPNGEAVKQELNGLRQAEAEMDVLMRDNDVFSQNFKKLQSQGLTNPQIYDWMIQNGLTQEQLEPFAHYINANARVQGMQEATKQKIEEVVSGVVQDWSYHGELNGQKMDGEQVVYVQDSEGRTLIVGSGDVAFDSTTGRAKEDVGDMLICLDPNTKEMVYLKKDEVTLFQTQRPEDFANEYRQRLQMINSQPYNEAAQEQAMQEAGKSENQNQSESNGINQNQNSEPNGSEKAPQVDTTSPEAGTTSTEDNTTKEDLAPQEQPQQTRKFADGTDVPMTTDSKGRPTPDYGAMKPEQAAEILSQDFGENSEKVVDGQIKKAEKALKDAEKMKVDYSAEPNDILEQEQVKAQTIEAAKKQLEQAQNIKKAMTAKAVAETMGKPSEEKVEGANEASSEVAKKFQNAPRLQGNHVSKRLPNGDKISGHYEIVPAESLTPSHDAMNDYKKSEGFPVDAEGRTINDRDYEHDKAAQQTTDQMAQKYSGQAITQVPTVSDEGIVYDGNGRTMAGQKAAKNGTDGEYIEDLLDNAQNYGFTKEQIEQSGIEHPRLVMVTDERLPYDTATFSMFNRNEKKTQSNTEQAVAKAKTLTSDEVGAIVADIEGNGSLDAFFNNSKAINDLVRTLVDKGVIGQNEVAGFMDGPDRLSAQGKEYVKNLLLGSVFKPETIRMLGIEPSLKIKAIAGIRSIMENLKLGDYSLRDEIDNAIQLMYESKKSKSKDVAEHMKSSDIYGSPRERFTPIEQAIALALDGKVSVFRDLMDEYNKLAKSEKKAGAANNMYADDSAYQNVLSPEELVNKFLEISKAIKENNIKLYGNETGHSETERGNDVAGNEKPSNEAGGAAGTAEVEPERNDEWYNNAAVKVKTAKGEERKQILHDMGEYVKDYAKKAGFDEPVIYDTWEDAEKDIPGIKEEVTDGITDEETALGGFAGENKVYFIMEDEGVDDINEVKSSFNHESTHVDNYNDPSRKEAIIASIKDFKTVKYTDLENAIEYVAHTDGYTKIAEKMLANGEDPSEMLAEEFLANAVEEIYRSGEDVISEITANETLQKLALDAYKFRENDRRGKERQGESGNPANGEVQAPHVLRSEETSGTDVETVQSKPEANAEGGNGNGRENVEGRGVDDNKPNSVGFTPKQTREHQASVDEKRNAYIKALQDGKSAKEVEDAATKYEFAFKDHQNMMGIMDEASVEDLWKKELEKAKASVPLPLLPKEEKPDPKFNPIEAAAEDFKKEHPLSEDEILNTTAFDDLPDDHKQYCIDAALDYLNGEDTSAISEAYYRNAYEKRSSRPAETAKVAKADSETVKAGQAEVSADPMEGIKNAAEGFEQEKAERERKQKEATQKVLNVIKASNEKTKTRKQLEAEKNAADNEFEAFMKELRKKQSGQLNSGFIDQNLIEAAPKMFSLAAKCAYTRIKLGMYDAKEVVKDLRNRFKEAFEGFDKRDVETFYSEIMNQKWRDGDKRMSLNDWAEHYRKLSPEYKEKLEGDSKDAEERKAAEKKFLDKIGIKLAFQSKINGIVELRKMAEECGLKDIKDTDLQELAETAIVKRARGIATSASTNEAKKFELIKKLYQNQPSLNQRDSERVMKQQYSTPAPYAFLADMYVKGGGKEVKSALEPSAGNGMLTIGLPMDVVHVNDIDAQRLANLRRQGFKNVTSQDGTQPFADKDVDVVVTNPPFGSATPKEYDGYKISSLEGQMAINALESMKDDGRAAIIIGGKTEYAKNGSLNPKDKAFLGYLYSHYNVEDVINVDGSLYAKQGTTYPTRIILINGRRLDENAFPPVKSKARAETVKDYDELYKRISDDILRGERMDSSIKEGEGSARPELDRPSSADTHEEGVRMGGQRGGEQKASDGSERLSSEPTVSRTNDDLENQRGAEPKQDGGLLNGDNGTDRTGAESSPSEGAETRANEQRVSGRRGLGGNDSKPSTSEPADNGGGRPRGQLQRVDESVRGLTTEKVTYAPRSENPFTLKAVMPADQQEAVNKNLEKLGDADQFLVDELGYNDKEDLYSHLAAEQVDSVALALQQAKKGNAFIIGDMTGIGKGRQAASLIRYAKKQGQVPVYFTKTAGLLSDVYRDLVDIGSPELRPFVFGSAKEAAITDSEGNVKFALPSKSEVKRVLDYIEKNGKLPKEYDYVLTTYSQVSNGVYEFDENGARKERKLAKGKSFGAAALSGQRRRDAIEKLMDNGYLILDESHTAGGDSGQGNYFQHIIQKAKNVTFFSATFAKRPDNMPIYALRTAMNQGGLKSSDLIDAVKRGGATLQEIMSQTLTQCGQMIRRERDMTGVTIDWRAIDEPEKVKEQREQYDSIIGLFNDIINFQKTYVSGYVEEQNEAMAAMQATMGIKRGTEALGIKNVPFASKAFNTVQQVLLSLKAKSAAERAIDYLKQGMKPVIALNNTNESQTGNIALGEEMDAPDLGTSLRKGLEGTLRYTSKNAKDESSSGYIRLEDLGDDAVEAYHNLEKKIKETSTGLSLSPIDVIKNELEKAGYKVGELTGRSTEFVYNENGTVTKVKRTDTDKKKLAREFNDGQIDALILNKSAATGISLHASSKYKDQRKRVMIVAQQQLDVNDEVQMRGRIDRTGQVARGAYEYVVSLIPAEQRLLMMFKAKLKSLDANTTSSQKSKFNEMEVADITNKYGDKVVREYMAEHLDLYSRMADPFGWEKSFGDDLSSTPTQSLVVTKSGVGDGEAGADASKLLGRMALLKVAEQEKMLNEIGELYANEIQRLNEMGENDLEITELPLKAKTISKEVWKEGAEPGGDNAFADNTYIEKVNMAILKKPMKAEEVKKAQDGLTGGKSWDEYKEEKWKAIESYFVNKGAEEGAKIEERARKAAAKAREKYIKDAKRGQKDSGMTDEQIAQMAIYQQDNIYKQESAKSEDLIKNLKNKAGMFLRVLETFNTEDAYVLPVDMNKPNELSGFGNSYGRLIDIKITDNFSPNASTVSFATLDGRRKITFPISGTVGSGENRTDVIAAIDRMTRQASGLGDKHLRVLSMDVANWDKLVSNESRKDGYIVTGNLMQALIDSKNQGVGGQLVKYTTDTGEVKTGILMPDRFKPTDVANEYPISSVADKFELPSHKGGIEQAVSSDGEVKVILGFDHGDAYYQIQVPKSKAKGGKYFLDKDLLSMVRGHNFESRGNRMMANIDENQLRPVLARLSNLGVKVREERKSSEDGTHFRTSDATQGNDAQGIVANHISNVSEKVGVKANEVNSVDEITNPRVKERIENGENVTGWYDEKSGEVHLYMPNIHDRYTAEKTIWHEVVGHKGMRELFGEDRFNRFLRDVWYDLDKPEYAVLKKLVMEEMKYNPFNVYNAIEEGIARLAEDGRGEAGLWNNIKNKISDFLHEIGYRLAPNTKDVKYLLWLSKNLQKNPNDPYWKMRAEAVKYRLDHEDVPSVIEHDGMLYDNDGKIYKGLEDLPKAEYQEATDGQIHFRTTPSTGTALDRYHRSLDEHGYMFTESYMDNMLSLKNLMTAIVPDKKVEDIASSENPYILQNTMQGAMSDAAQMFERNVMKPLDKAMAGVLDAFDGKNDDEKIRNFNLYMITKHGLERNRILYVRDALKDMRMDEKKKKLADTIENDWNNEKATLDDKLERGDIDLKEYYKQMDDFIRTYVDETNKFDAGEHDYSGIHAIQKVEKNSDPYDDAEAIQSVIDSEGRMEDIKKGAVKDYWDKVKTATQYAIDCDYRNGLISRELYSHVSAMFNWYVPLRKYDEATAEDTYGYITEKGDPKSYIGKTIMRARGHKYLSETNILAQIGAMGNRAIKNGGQNAIKQAFARFIRNNSNNNLVTETSVWYVSDPITQTTVESYPDIPDDATADEISQIVSDFNMEMKDLQSKGLATKVYRRGRIGYKFQRAENKSQHIVDVMIAGKKHSFIVNGNPRAAQALNGLLENSAAKGIMKPLGSISRMMAQLCTSYNPEFVMRNVMRDAEFASSNVTAKEGARYGAIWAKYYAQLGLYKGASNISLGDLSGSTGLGLFAKYRNGTLDMNDKLQRYFKEFMENGGETGWVQIKNMKEWEKQYKQDVKGERSKIQKGGKMIRDFFFGNLENLNEVAENIARFSTYCASRDFGRSVVRSTYDAKEVSTNFNRHGSGDAIKSFKNGEMTGTKAAERWAYGFTSSYLRHCSMFFNAGIQSTNLLVKNLKNHPVGTSVNMLSIPFALGALGALLNNALIASEDEKDRKGVKDPYGELPDYVRRNNLCIYKGGGEFITIPLAIELRAFYGLGDLAAGLTFSPNVSGQKNPYFDAVGCMSQLVPVMDYLGNSSAGKKPLEETIKAISPSAIAPFIEWEQNSDWKGAPIERRGDWNENVPAWQRAYNGTPEGLKSVNKWVNAQTNDVAKGNEDMLGNGFLDMVTNPSMVNHFFGGIGGGAATFAERTLGTIKHGSDTETKDIPFVRSLLYTPSEQSSLQRTKSKWYNYKDEMEVTMANVDRLKSKNVPIDKRLQNIGEYYHFQNSKDAVKVRVIELAEKQMKVWKKLRDKSGDTESIKFANENIDRIMMEAVEQLDKLN